MQKPIFRPSFGNRPDRIVGREDVVQAYVDGLASYPGDRGRAMLVLGQRGMGKTALLLEMVDIADDSGYVAVRTTCGRGMLDNILDLLQRAGSRYVDDKKLPVRGFSAGAMGFSFGLTFTEEARTTYGFRVKLEMICDRLADAGKGVAIFVDEVRPNSEEMRQLVTAYQELAGEEKNIALAMAGLPAVISNLVEEETLTFLNRATRFSLAPVSIGAVRAYYASAFARLDRRVSDAVLDAASELTEGFPYMLQLVGYYLVEYSNEGDELTMAVLEEAKKSALADLDRDVLEAMLHPLSAADVAFLSAMAQDDGPTRVGDLESRLGVSQGHVQSYRRRLLDAGVITSPRRGELAFTVSRLGDYLRKTRS